MANRKSGMEEAAAAARGEAPATPKAPRRATSIPAAVPSAKPRKSRAPQGTEDLEYKDSARPRGGRSARADEIEATSKAADASKGIGLNAPGIEGYLTKVHAILTERHAAIGSALAKTEGASDLAGKWATAGERLRVAGEHLGEARTMTENWGSDFLRTNIGHPRPAANHVGELKEALKHITSAHNFMENKDTRLAFETATGAEPGSLDVADISTLHPNALKGVKDSLGKMQSKRIEPRPFQEFGSGKVRVRRGTPEFELLTGKLGAGVIRTAAKQEGFTGMSDLAQKAKLAGLGTRRTSKKGAEREDNPDFVPAAPGQKRRGKKTRVKGITGAKVVSGQAPNSRGRRIGGAVFGRNNRPAGMQPGEYNNIDMDESPQSEGLTQQQRLENANAVASGKLQPHNAGPVSPITGYRTPTKEQLDHAKTLANSTRTPRRRRASTDSVPKDRTSAATKRAAAAPGVTRRRKSR
jgi:hypothetical protein